MVDPTFSLAGDFPAMDYQQWRGLADAALKGKPLDKLVVQVGGLTVQPLYTRAADRGGAEGWPGRAPYVRGARPSRPSWDVRQVYHHPDPAALNRAVLTDLERGVTSLELRLDASCRAGTDLTSGALAGDGVAIAHVADLSTALAGVYDDLAPVGLAAGAAGGPAAAIFLAFAESRRRDRGAYRAFLNIDPIEAWASGEATASPERDLRILGDVARFVTENWPQVRAARADGALYHDAGATEADELAAVLATGVAYLEAMTAAGLTVVDAGRQIVLRVALDADLFTGVAKLRALRQTWGRVLEAAGAHASVASARLEATTSRAMMTQRDPWVNILRNTVACFAGAVGGADTLHVRPFDEAVGLPDSVALRVARNTQTVLQDETHLAQVIDPAGGAWYVEDLTRQMAEAAWAQFQAIQRNGGIVGALRSGLVQDRIDATWGERKTAIGRRKEPITGVSEFPNLAESPLADRRPDVAEVLRAVRAQSSSRPASVDFPAELAPGEAMAHAVRSAASGAHIDQLVSAWPATLGAAAPIARALGVRPRAAGFEALRDASDRYLATRGHRPQVLLIKLGPLAEHTARVTYAKNFFEAGGIEAVDADPVTNADDASARAKGHSEARMAVLTGADTRYAEEVAAIAPALKQAGVQRLFLAGRPGDREADYRSAGVDEFIFIGCDVLTTLERAHADLFTIEGAE